MHLGNLESIQEATPRATLTLLSCSPNFPRASITRYTHAKHEPILKYLSVSTRGVIGQFCGPYFTVRPAKLQLVSFLAHPTNLIDIINILPRFLGPYCKLRNGKNSLRNLQYGPRTRLVRGVYIFFDIGRSVLLFLAI